MLFTDKSICKFYSFQEGQYGLFYDGMLNVLIVGRIKNYRLIGKVISNGITTFEKCIAGFYVGYRYNDWDKSNMIYMGTLRTHSNYYAYIDFLNKNIKYFLLVIPPSMLSV